MTFLQSASNDTVIVEQGGVKVRRYRWPSRGGHKGEAGNPVGQAQAPDYPALLDVEDHQQALEGGVDPDQDVGGRGGGGVGGERVDAGHLHLAILRNEKMIRAKLAKDIIT